MPEQDPSLTAAAAAAPAPSFSTPVDLAASPTVAIPAAEPIAQDEVTAAPAPVVEEAAPAVSVAAPEPAAAASYASACVQVLQEKLADREHSLAGLEGTALRLATEVSLLKSTLNEAAETLIDVMGKAESQVSQLLADLQADLSRFSPQPIKDSASKIEVVLKRTAPIGDEICDPGTTLGFVTLAAGVSLDYLVHALRNELAAGQKL